jgi:hypothetical protein
MTTITVYDLSESSPGPCATFWDVTPEYAAAYCYAEATGRLSQLFSLSYDGDTRYKSKFPLCYGKRTVSCGDYAAPLNQEVTQ